MDPLIELLRANPNCKVTICTSTRKVPQYGDIKVVRGKRYKRVQRMSQGCGVVRRGKPVWEWVPEVEE